MSNSQVVSNIVTSTILLSLTLKIQIREEAWGDENPHFLHVVGLPLFGSLFDWTK